MKTSQTIVLLLILLLLVGGSVYFYTSRIQPIEPDNWTVPLAATTEKTQQDIVWSYEDLGEDAETLIPRTKVTVRIWDKQYDAGTYMGSCVQKTPERLEPNEISGIGCWYAGSGDDIGVFSKNGKMTIERREIDEGTAETGGYIGKFETLISI